MFKSVLKTYCVKVKLDAESKIGVISYTLGGQDHTIEIPFEQIEQEINS